MSSPISFLGRSSVSDPVGLADDRVLTLSEFAKIAGISLVTLRRRIAAHDGPIVTKLSERRLGIRVRHAREWLDARASSNLLEA